LISGISGRFASDACRYPYASKCAGTHHYRNLQNPKVPVSPGVLLRPALLKTRKLNSTAAHMAGTYKHKFLAQIPMPSVQHLQRALFIAGLPSNELEPIRDLTRNCAQHLITLNCNLNGAGDFLACAYNNLMSRASKCIEHTQQIFVWRSSEHP